MTDPAFPVPPEDKPDTARITDARFSDCSIVDYDGNLVTLRCGDYVRTDRVADGATYRPYLALRDIADGQIVHANEIARPNSGRARYWAARFKFRNRPNRAKRRVVYARFKR